MISYRKSDIFDRFKNKEKKCILVINAAIDRILFEFVDDIGLPRRLAIVGVIEGVVKHGLTEQKESIYSIRAYDLPSDTHTDVELALAMICDKLNSIFGTKMNLNKAALNNGYWSRLDLTEEQIEKI